MAAATIPITVGYEIIRHITSEDEMDALLETCPHLTVLATRVLASTTPTTRADVVAPSEGHCGFRACAACGLLSGAPKAIGDMMIAPHKYAAVHAHTSDLSVPLGSSVSCLQQLRINSVKHALASMRANATAAGIHSKKYRATAYRGIARAERILAARTITRAHEVDMRLTAQLVGMFNTSRKPLHARSTRPT